MPVPLQVIHDRDPREAVWQDVGEHIKGIEPLCAGVLLIMYERGMGGEARTKSGIFLPDQTTSEDKYQGKAGLVVKLGPIAFTDDASHQWGDMIPQVGDWVIVNVGDSFPFDLPNKRRARIVDDVSVKAIIQQPDAVW